MTTTDTTQRDLAAAIKADHETVKQLFADIKAGRNGTEAWEMLVRALAVHETAEEEILYPTVRSKGGDDAKQIVEQRLAEEDEAKKLLVDMEKLGPSGNGFGEMLAKLEQAVVAHAEAEEREVLPKLASVDESTMHALAAAYHAAKALAPTHPHKAAPESAVGNMVVGPMVAIVDRTRDLIRDVMKKTKQS
ncbi:MAG: hemerythrin domain-containing protein [Actinobacteria bacterium]|nr:hemerythrin domain-containing protein [Actinomycetota bacterium]MBV8961343.1 hemerythrin domain-containing protein [Actinomycetota bacterium]